MDMLFFNGVQLNYAMIVDHQDVGVASRVVTRNCSPLTSLSV